MFAAYLFREWRETRKLSLDDRNARREGYAKQVQMLMTENRALAADMASLRGEYDKYRNNCADETAQLRHDIVTLENRLAGFRRSFATLEISLARFIAQISVGEMPRPETIDTLTTLLERMKTE